MAAPRPPRFDATADEVARVAAAAPDWPTLAAAARPCVACPELAAVRQHVVVGDVPDGRSPALRTRRRGPGRDRGRDRPAVRRPLRRAARPAARRGRARAFGGGGAEHRQVPASRATARRRRRRWPGAAAGCAASSSCSTRRSSWRWACRRRSGSSGRARCWRGPGRAVRTTTHGRALWTTYHPSAAIRFGPNGAPRAALLADLRPSRPRSAGGPRETAAPAPDGRRTRTRWAGRSPRCSGPVTSSSSSGRWAPARPRSPRGSARGSGSASR